MPQGQWVILHSQRGLKASDSLIKAWIMPLQPVLERDEEWARIL
jgi:hypothetical protein